MLQYERYFYFFPMNPSVPITWDWNPLAESPEIAARNAELDKDFARRWETADFSQSAEELRKSLYWTFTPAKNIETVAVVSDTSNPSPDIRARIWKRHRWQVPEKWQEALSSYQKKENKDTTLKLFFAPQHLEKQYIAYEDHTGEKRAQNQEWFEANTWPDGPLHTSFERIMEHCMLPEHIRGKSLSDIWNTHPRDAKIVHDALVDGFLLEIYEHTLTWRVNYPEEHIQTLISDIQDIHTPPYEKLRIFGEIHTLVETSVGRGGKKQAQEYKNMKARQAQAYAKNTLFYTQQRAQTQNPNLAAPYDSQQEGLWNENPLPVSGDVSALAGWEADSLGERTKTSFAIS